MRLDGVPSRASRLTDRQPAQQLGAEAPVPDKLKPVEPLTLDKIVKDDIKPPKKTTKRKAGTKKVFIGALLAILVTGLVVAGFLIAPKIFGGGIGVDKDKYQAVFLTSGQVYFGNLTEVDKNYLKLSEVFYIQQGSGGQGQDSETTASGEMQLIKLGDEVHGPEDTMVINRDQVLFFENLKPNGRVAELIQQYSREQ